MRTSTKIITFVSLNILILFTATYWSWGSTCCDDSSPPVPDNVHTCLRTDHDRNPASNPNAEPFPTDLMKECCDCTGAHSDCIDSDFKPIVRQRVDLCKKCINTAECNSINSAAAAAATGLQGAEQAHGYADRLVGDEMNVTGNEVPPAQNPAQDAATASDITTTDTKTGDAKGGTRMTLASGTEKPGQDRGIAGSGGGGRGGGGGAGGSGDGIGAAPSEQTSAAPNSGAATAGGLNPETGAAAYSSGAGAGGGDSGGSGGALGARRDPGIGGAGRTGSMEFGAQDEGKSGPTSEDPEDYFTRIGLDSSIFKVVHDRYQRKHGNWIKEQMSTQPAQKLK